MRRIRELTIRQFRNISDLKLELKSPMQLFYGDNGAGKSSILEAIVVLATGRSWRSNLLSQLVQHNQEAFNVQATVSVDSIDNYLGFKRYKSGRSETSISSSPCPLSDLARLLPTQLISTQSYRFLTDGPKHRRSFFNWGLFHVEPSFNATWQRLQKVLKQRNASLKNHNNPREVEVWDDPLVKLSEAIDTLRLSQHIDINALFSIHLDRLKHPAQLELQYDRGWSPDVSLSEAIKNSFKRDSILGYTQLGPHKADFQIYSHGVPAAQILSQGQQKLAMVALHLAQVDYLKQQNNSSAIVLLDDLTAELDQHAQKSLLSTLNALDSQTFITSIDPLFLSNLDESFDGDIHAVSSGEIAGKVIS